MSEISTWILSIAGVCFISVIVDLVMPDGKTSSQIKNVMSYIIVFVVIIPIPKLFGGSINFDGLFSDTNIQIQEEYIYNVNQNRLNSIQNTIETKLEEEGIIGAVVSVSANVFDYDMQIDAVYVDLYNVVISKQNTNIDIKTEVVSVVLSVVNIAKDKVIFYE